MRHPRRVAMRVPYNASVFRELSIGHRSRPKTLRMQAVTGRVTATVHTVTGWVKGTPEMRAYTPREERISVLYTRSAARLAVLASKCWARRTCTPLRQQLCYIRQSDRRLHPGWCALCASIATGVTRSLRVGQGVRL